MSLQSADRTERTANTPRGRTRHGCWTCRKRRRKCKIIYWERFYWLSLLDTLISSWFERRMIGPIFVGQLEFRLTDRRWRTEAEMSKLHGERFEMPIWTAIDIPWSQSFQVDARRRQSSEWAYTWPLQICTGEDIFLSRTGILTPYSLLMAWKTFKKTWEVSVEQTK
jgi:hypothetical protein